MLKKIKVEDAVGMTLGHDMTRVIPGKCKEVAFRRGYIIREEDIPEFHKIGKEHIYVIEGTNVDVHEEDAARRLAAAFAGPEFKQSGVKEGRIDLISTVNGVLKVNVPLLTEVNSFDGIVLSTRHSGTVCQPDMVVAGTKIIPLYMPDAGLRKVENLCRKKGAVLKVMPFALKKVGVVVTGSEVYKGLVQDKFTDTIKRKVEALGARLIHSIMVPDDENMIAGAILDMKTRGAELIFACGGFSVDPDDVTVEGIKRTGAKVVAYGAPVMPGSMCLVGYLDGTPILGAPACAIWNKATVVEVFLPRMLAGDPITHEEVAALGHGGLCLGCQPCGYPLCPFCK
jgi:Probable molybdopterin binding domain